MTDDLDTLQARLDALKAAYLPRNGFLCMYEHGRPVKAGEVNQPIRYRITPLGRKLLEAGPPEYAMLVGWDANGSPVEGVR